MQIRRHPGFVSGMSLLILFFIIVLWPVNVFASQLHINHVTLGEIAQRGVVFLGTVTSVLTAKRIVNVKIKKHWARKENASLIGESGKKLSDSERSFVIYQGVVWDDPGESPVDNRVPGALPITEVTVGQEIVVVPNMGFELLPAGPRILEKLDIFFLPGGLVSYRRNSPAGRLYKDLRDLDLREPALEALYERKLLDPKPLLALEGRELYDIGYTLGARMPAPDLNKWLLAMISAAGDGPRRKTLDNIMSESGYAGKIAPATRLALVHSLDLSDGDQQFICYKFLINEAEDLKLHPDPARTEHAAGLTLGILASDAVSIYRWDVNELLRTFINYMPKQKLVAMIKQIGSLVVTSKTAKKSKTRIDEEFFDFFLKELKRSPSAEYLPELAAIDLSFYPRSNQGSIECRVQLLDAGLSIAAADPGSSKAVYEALKKWARNKKDFDPDIVVSMDGEGTSEKRERWKKTVERFNRLNVIKEKKNRK